MRMADFDYVLPPAAIAQRPLTPRDSSRLLVLERETGEIAHRRFLDLPDYLQEGDLLVLNDTRVLPARLLGRKETTGGAVEVLLLKEIAPDTWEALARPGRRLGVGAVVLCGDGQLRAEVLGVLPSGGRIVRLVPSAAVAGQSVKDLLHVAGELPLPPYITDGPPPAEREVYQTVYARAEGSTAAPTAGLHFTARLFAALEEKGVRRVHVTLHVGLGTFRPVQTENARDHEMHEEPYSVSEETVDAINATKAAGGRVIAVGTTSARTLESAADDRGRVHAKVAATRLYIMPGYRFRVVDALVTNFHMPRSTLLLLVSAFAGRENVLRAYNEALQEGYRFLSFGDACLLL